MSFTYKAFLSYSHKDSRTVKRIHKALEGFRIDKDLMGTEGPHGPIDKSLRPIFLDRHDFSAGHSVTGQTVEKLKASPFLIVACSPNSAKSTYVNEEIRLFKAMGRGSDIIPVIIDGERGGGDTECYPPALRFKVNEAGEITDEPEEILGADIQERGDGWELAVSKVVARLLGRGTDDIFRRAIREKRRQQRNQLMVASVMIVLALVGGGFAWQSMQQQKIIYDVEAIVKKYQFDDDQAGQTKKRSLTEAITSIAKRAAKDTRLKEALKLIAAGKAKAAEPLLEAVANDKKKRAKQQSKEAAEAFRNLAALKQVTDPGSARHYYAEAAKLDPDHLGGLLSHAELQQQAGALDNAESAYRRMITIGKPGRHDREIYWARLGIGDIKVKRGDLNAAKADYTQAQQIAERLAKSDPGNAGWQRDLSVSLGKIGDVLVSTGQREAALKSYRAGLEIAERLAKSDPGNAVWQRDLSVSYERIGDVLVSTGQREAALKSYRASHEVAERLAKSDPGNAVWQRDLSVSHNKIGDVLLSTGQREEALKSYRAGLEIAERLAKSDPGNAGWQHDLSVSHTKIGDVLVRTGQREAALKSYRAGLEIAERLAKSDPGNAGSQRDLSVSHNKIGDVLVSTGQREAALKSYRASHAIFERLAKSDPGNAGWQRDLSVSHNKIGDVLLSTGQREEALKSYRAGLEIRERLAKSDPGNAGWQRDLSVSLGKIGDVLLSTGQREAALKSYRAGLEIAERLAKSDPGNAGWQRDVWVSLWRFARYGSDPVTNWQAVVDKLKEMKAKGTLAPVDERFIPIAEKQLAKARGE